MKRLLTLFTVLFFIIGFVACDTKTSNKQISNEPSVEKSETVFEQFEKELTKNKYSYEKVTMAAETIGAKSGIKYKFNDNQAELYEFDKSSDSYKSAEESQAIVLEDFGSFSAIVKGGYALLSDDKTIIDIFNSIIK